MERYSNNGICLYIKKQVEKGANSNILFYDITRSLLVIADKKNNEPIALLIDDRVEIEENVFSEEEKRYANICILIATRANLPLFWIKYKDREILMNEDQVLFWDSINKTGRFQSIKMGELESIFKKSGISCSLVHKTPQKWKNDSLSSAFHIWQRDCFKVGVFTDVDLIRMEGDEIKEVIELKRSFFQLEKWHPFNNDINNFSIISNLCRMIGNVPLSIVYNLFTSDESIISRTKPQYIFPSNKGEKRYYDIVDKLKVFTVEMRENVYCYPLPYPIFKEYSDVDTYVFE